MPSSDECGHEQPMDSGLEPYGGFYTHLGRQLTRTWIEAQANEAEEGYDIERLTPRNVVPQVHHVHDTDEVSGGET